MRTFERRAFPLSDITVRAADDNTGRLKFHGRAVVYGQLSEDLGGWQEVIAPGAATRTLAAGPDCRFLINHDANLLLGRTASGTVTLTESEGGLDVDSEMADVSYARDLAVLLERGDISQMSFGFWVTSDSWSGNLHQVHEFDLDGGDVSAVTFPAFPQTSAELRQQLRDRGLSSPAAPVVAPDSALSLRALIDAPTETHRLLFPELRAGKVLSSENSDLVRQAIEALSALLDKAANGGPAPEGYPLNRAQHRLRELELLAQL